MFLPRVHIIHKIPGFLDPKIIFRPQLKKSPPNVKNNAPINKCPKHKKAPFPLTFAPKKIHLHPVKTNFAPKLSYFPKWQLPKSVIAAALGPLAHPSRSARPLCSLRVPA